MGNYNNLEIDFVKRTLHLIAQYKECCRNFKFENQYNHTLLINCLLGLIVMPKAKVDSFLPNDRLLTDLKQEMGIVTSSFNPALKDLKSFVMALRNSIAHFDIEFISHDDNSLIDEIRFLDRAKGAGYVVASFVPSELLGFVQYYGGWLIHNLEQT